MILPKIGRRSSLSNSGNDGAYESLSWPKLMEAAVCNCPCFLKQGNND